MKSSMLALQNFVMAHFGNNEVEMIEFGVWPHEARVGKNV